MDLTLQKNINSRIFSLLDKQGKNREWLSAQSGINKSYLSQILNCKNNKQWDAAKLQLVADAFGITLAELLDSNEQKNLHISGISEIKVVGEVQAGVWSEAIYWEESEQYTIPMINSAYKNAYALRVRGDSMDLIYQDGSYVIVAPLSEKPLKDKQKVIVQRKLKTGQVEATIKQLVIVNGVAELWPRSTNPKHQAPISIHWPYNDPENAEIETVEICGIVVGAYTEEDY